MDLTLVVVEAVLPKMESALLLLEELSAGKHLVDELTVMCGYMENCKATILDRLRNPSRHEVVWSVQVRKCLYAIDDVVDDILTEATSKQTRQLKNIRCFMSNYLVMSKVNLGYYARIARETRVTRQALYDLNSNRSSPSSFNIDIPEVKEESRETNSYVDVNAIVGRKTNSYVKAIVGREVDKMAIVEILSGYEGRERAILVIPITGMGGMGKTTLAQLLFNDDSIRHHYDIRLWVHVGLKFDFAVIIKKILEQKDGRRYDRADLERLQNDLLSAIGGKRYLLVLDDVSTVDREVWFRLMNLLSIGASGSAVILTTCSRDLASNLGTVKPYELGPLSPNDAWSLFTSMAFDQTQDVVDEELVSVAKEICQKAGNVPLILKILGSMLHGMDKSKWKEMQNMEASPYKATYLTKLSHSFLQLRSSAKQCFAYCAIFPRGFQIHKRHLLQLWVAQGFIQPLLHDPNQSLEDAAEDCFTELQNWSLFKDVHKDEQGNISSFKMNELEYDLAQYVADYEIKVMHTMISCTISDQIYHVSIDGSFNLTKSEISRLPRTLRSFVNVSQSQSAVHLNRSHFAKLISHLRHLRVLDLHSTQISAVPASIGSLRKLRHLNLSDNPFKLLPDSLTNLVNLQVLDLSCCKYLETLPVQLRRLVNLRHLYLSECEKLTGMPVGMGQMTSLQTLSHFVVSKNSRLDELNCLNLKADLTFVFASQQHNKSGQQQSQPLC